MSVRAALLGIGESRVGRVPGRSSLQLQADAATAALTDAGLARLRGLTKLIFLDLRSTQIDQLQRLVRKADASRQYNH